MRTFALLVVCLIVRPALPASAQDVTAITGATVMGPGLAPITDAVVVIDGTRIARVGAKGTTPIPPNATVIDARGKFVIPGLADMHNHVRTGSFRCSRTPG